MHQAVVPEIPRNPISGINRVESKKPECNKNELDPLLDLVIASESPDSHQETLLRIAEEARISSETKNTLESKILSNMGIGVDVDEDDEDDENDDDESTKEHMNFTESSDSDICRGL